LIPSGSNPTVRDEEDERYRKPVRTHIYYVDDIYEPWNYYYGAPWWYDDYYYNPHYPSDRISTKERIAPGKRDSGINSEENNDRNRIKSSTRDSNLSDLEESGSDTTIEKDNSEEKLNDQNRIVPNKR